MGKTYVFRDGKLNEALDPLDPVPETEQAVADVREFKVLSAQLGVELIGGLTSGPYSGYPWLCAEVVTVAAEGTDKRILRLKLADHFHGALIALRAIEAKRHVAHQQSSQEPQALWSDAPFTSVEDPSNAKY